MKRRVTLLLLLLVGSAIVNVAVAWGCVLVHGQIEQAWSPHHNPSSEDPLVIFITKWPGYVIVSGCARSGTLLDRYPGSVQTYAGSVWWVQDAIMPNLNNYGIACGMPMLTLTAWRTVRDDDEMQFPGIIHGGIVWDLMKAKDPRATVDRVPPLLALKPIWPGFAINTVFYAAVLWGGWLLFAAPFALRRRRRIKHGLCPKCAYPVGTSAVCTECGAPRDHQ